MNRSEPTKQQRKQRNRVELDRTIRRDKILYLGSKCVICGSKNKLEFHHKNKDGKHSPTTWAEIKRGKIELLCIPCHKTVDGILSWMIKKVDLLKIIVKLAECSDKDVKE